MPSSRPDAPTRLAACAAMLFGLMALIPPTAQAADPFTGRFVADVQGEAIELTLAQSGTAVEGRLQAASGQPTLLSGQARGQVATGLAGNQGGVGAFEARRDGDALALVLAQIGPDGSPQQVTLEFRRAGAAAAAPRAGTQAPGPSRARQPGATPGAGSGGDPRLVGRWSKNDSYRSGGFTAASETLMEIAADGRVAFGAGRVIAGDASTSADSGRGGVQVAEWRARSGVLSMRESGTTAWRDIGRYEVSDAGMLIYLPGGSKELWYRQ
jgi:hypothetical protein